MTHKKILITGASSGIGRAICERLLAEGHAVVGAARDFGKFPCDDPKFQPVRIDLADLDNLPDALKRLTREHPDFDALISNAGAGLSGNLETCGYRQMREHIELNFLSHAYVARALLPEMKRRGAGDLIFMGSQSGVRGHSQGPLYCAAKFALRGFAQSLREDCAAAGLRVSIVNPGMVRTPFFDRIDVEPGESPENWIEPEDIAEAAAMILNARRETVFDEINVTPLKKVVRFKKRKEG